MLIGGEESSGLTTRGHVPDKDGIWASVLVMDMLAYYGLRSNNGKTSLVDIWEQSTSMDVAWQTYGGRIDVDAATGPKEQLLHYFLDVHRGWQPGDEFPKLEGFDIYYLGGTRYDMVEMFLMDDHYGKKHFLRVRASGTEPLVRIYFESADEAAANKLLNVVLSRLDAVNEESIQKAYSIDFLADLLASTRFSEQAFDAVRQVILAKRWEVKKLVAYLETYRPHVESRNVKLIDQWLEAITAQQNK